jgi:ABC-type polysaccharide/polyol phosphate transport system ATPase subunit
MSDIAVKVNRLSKQYHLNNEKGSSQVNTVLKDLSFDILRGEKWGIIGKNGSGKSTLLKILSGIVKPTFGSASIYGSLTHILSIGDNFIPDLTGRENVEFFFRLNGFSKKKSLEALERTIDFAGIGEYIYAPVKTYSDGMYLRLAFSACLELSADILLIDEVFSAGDAAFQEKLKLRIQNKLTSADTMLMVSHNPDEIIEYCTHCIWLDRGEIKLMGPVKDVESAYYYQLAKENWEKDYTRPLSKSFTDAEMSFIPIGNEYLKVSGFFIKAHLGSANITYESGIKFSISIEKKQAGLIIHPAIKIYDYLMNKVMLLMPEANSSDDQNIIDHEDTIGKIKYVTTLPPKILTFGNYYAELVFSKNSSTDKDFIEEAIKVPNKLHFEVKQGLIPDLAGGTDNISIKPHCDWEITLIE